MASADTIQRPAATVRPSSTRVAPHPTNETSLPTSRVGPLSLLLLLILFGWAANQAAFGKHYTPRSNVGFYLGVTGTLMMVALLAYPLRKHVTWMQRWGPLKHWFRIHMILGLVGPTLVLFHSTFHIRSPNAAVALLSMLVVVVSGVIGRFVYCQIHFGLYGSRATLDTLQASLAGRSDEAKSRLRWAPRVEQWLVAYQQNATRGERGFLEGLATLITMSLTRPLLAARCRRELRRVLRTDPHPECRGGMEEAVAFVSRYLTEVGRVAQFTTYERLFSLWHILHIPLIYLLAASTVFHVIAVYMY